MNNEGCGLPSLELLLARKMLLASKCPLTLACPTHATTKPTSSCAVESVAGYPHTSTRATGTSRRCCAASKQSQTSKTGTICVGGHGYPRLKFLRSVLRPFEKDLAGERCKAEEARCPSARQHSSTCWGEQIHQYTNRTRQYRAIHRHVDGRPKHRKSVYTISARVSEFWCGNCRREREKPF